MKNYICGELESRPIVKHPLCFSKKIKIFAALQILIFREP